MVEVVTQGSMVWFVQQAVATITSLSCKKVLMTLGSSIAGGTAMLAVYMFLKCVSCV